MGAAEQSHHAVSGSAAAKWRGGRDARDRKADRSNGRLDPCGDHVSLRGSCRIALFAAALFAFAAALASLSRLCYESPAGVPERQPVPVAP
jgi:hypothetical protein